MQNRYEKQVKKYFFVLVIFEELQKFGEKKEYFNYSCKIIQYTAINQLKCLLKTQHSKYKV